MSNFDLGSIPKMMARMFAAAATKSRVSSSSLSKVKTAGTDIAAPVAWSFSSRELRWWRLPVSVDLPSSAIEEISAYLSQKTLKFSASVQAP